MAEVIPFRGILYNPRKVDAGSVVAPPYDIITPEMREALYQRSPYNVVRIDAGAELEGDTPQDNRYTRAREALLQWLQEGVLQRAPEPAFYAYQVRYRHEGSEKLLQGFFALVRLEPLGAGRIHPHECTHSKARQDRLRLLQALRLNTSPIYAIYESPQRLASQAIARAIEGAPPFMEAQDAQGATHRLWVVSSPEALRAVKEDLEDKDIFIADGHHRYETALQAQQFMHREGHGHGPFDYVLMFLANTADGGITILPTHRVLRGLSAPLLQSAERHFQLKRQQGLEALLKAIKGKAGHLGLYCPEGYFALAHRGQDGLSHVPQALRGLDVVLLQELLVKGLAPKELAYEMSPARAEAMVRSQGWEAAFFLNPTRVEDVKKVALAGERMPPKSTYFYPKLLTGFVMGEPWNLEQENLNAIRRVS